MTDDMAKVIARLRELDAKATPGPWVSERQDDEDGSINYEVWTEAPGKYKPLFTIREYYDSKRPKEDAALIAYIRTNLAALLDAAEAGMNARDAASIMEEGLRSILNAPLPPPIGPAHELRNIARRTLSRLAPVQTSAAQHIRALKEKP